MKFKSFLGALAISLMPLQSIAQDSVKITSNYSDNQKYVCASYWNPNPRARLCYEGDDNVTLGFFLPPSKNTWKFVFGSTGGNEEAGLYFNQKKGPVVLGASAEYINGAGSGEAHARIDTGSNKVFGNNRVFLAYGNTGGASTFTAADFFNVGKYNFGIGAAFRDHELGKDLRVTFSGENQVRLYAARENRAKFFYANDGNSQSLTGFVRIGNDYSPYEPAGLDADRYDFFQQAAVHSRYWIFHPILPAQNTHLSEQGTVAFAPRFSKNKETRTTTYGIDSFYTYENFIGGYGFEKNTRDGETNSSHKISAGAVVGPARFIGTWESEKGTSVSGTLVFR
ncbi:MAG: hypothetical protein WC613_05705 [Candidatus Aenigmatarchaeota archaeon]